MSSVVKRVGESLVVHLDGELDLYSVQSLQRTIDEAFVHYDDVRHVIFNMRAVTFMDSSGVGAILSRYRDVRERGGRVIIVGMNPPVRTVYNLSGMAKIIPVFDSENQALNAVPTLV